MKLIILLSFLTILGLCFSFKGSKKPLVLCLACPGICPKTTTPKHMRELDTDYSNENPDYDTRAYSDDIPGWHYDKQSYWNNITKKSEDASQSIQFYIIFKGDEDNITTTSTTHPPFPNTTTTTSTTTHSPPPTTTTSTTTHSPPPTTAAPPYICRLCYEQCGY